MAQKAISINTPLTDEVLEELKIGDKVLISGVIYSARDAAHKRLVELISTCPTNWGLTPVAAIKWAEDNMLPYYRLGEYKTPEASGAGAAKDLNSKHSNLGKG